MIIQQLQAAIAARFIGGTAASALTTAFAGRYFREMAAAQNADGTALAYPYVVSEFPTSMASNESYGVLSGGCLSVEPVVIFKVIGRGGEAAVAAVMKTLCDTLDDAALTLASAKNIGLWRESEPTSLRLERDEAGNELWQWAVAYRYAIQ